MSLREPFLFIGLWLISLSFYAQLPSKGWSRTVTDSIINARSFSGHAVIQPAAGSLDSDILAVIDSSYVAATYQNYLKIKPLFDISGGFTQTDKASFFGNGKLIVAGLPLIVFWNSGGTTSKRSLFGDMPITPCSKPMKSSDNPGVNSSGDFIS